MSLKNHPNFHAIKFGVEIINAYYQLLRGPYFKNKTAKYAPNISEEIVEFVCKIEDKIDNKVNNGTTES